MKRHDKSKLICLEIIGKCGLECVHCSTRSNSNDPNILNLDLIYKVLNEGIELGFDELAISGGDPFIHPDFLQIIQYAKELGFYIITYTNGNLVNSDLKLSPITESNFQKLNNAGLDKIVFSLHSTDENVHDLITGRKGSFHNLIESIQNSKGEFSFQRELNFVIMKLNIQDKESLVLFMKQYDFTHVHFLRFVPHGRGLENQQALGVEMNELNIFTKDFEKYVNDINIDYSSSLPIVNIENNAKCRAGREEKLCITPKGYVFPCVALKNLLEGNYKNNVKNFSLKTILKESEIFKAINVFEKSNCIINWNCIECPAQQMIRNSSLEYSLLV